MAISLEKDRHYDHKTATYACYSQWMNVSNTPRNNTYSQNYMKDPFLNISWHEICLSYTFILQIMLTG